MTDIAVVAWNLRQAIARNAESTAATWRYLTSPLEPDGRERLTGLSIMVMAIANHELAKEHPRHLSEPEEIAEEQRREAARAAASKRPCPAWPQGVGTDAGKSCVSEVGHRGRHRFRFILPPTEGLN
jgi:hypothetical protein